MICGSVHASGRYKCRLPSLWLWFNDILCALIFGVYMWRVWWMFCGKSLSPLHYKNPLQKPLSNSIKWIHYHGQPCNRNKNRFDTTERPFPLFCSFDIMINGKTLANVQCLIRFRIFFIIFSLRETLIRKLNWKKIFQNVS